MKLLLIFIISLNCQAGFQAWVKDSIEYKELTSKKKVIIAIIDTGCDFSHENIKNLLTSDLKPATILNYGFDFSNQSTKPNDTHGHGTHITGIINYINPNSKLLILKYYDPKASGMVNLNNSINALEFAINSNVDIINYSGGGEELSEKEFRLIKEAKRKGILVVVAAGNDGSRYSKNYKYYPAAYDLDNIIAVGAIDKKNLIIESSNYGEGVDLVAPGNMIISTLNNNTFGELTGTSQATAFVSAAAAKLMEGFPSKDLAEIRQSLLSSKFNKKINYKLSIKNAISNLE